MVTMQKDIKFLIVFLGSRGGGEQLLLQTINDFAKNNLDFKIITSEEIHAKHLFKNCLAIYVPRKIGDLLNVLKLIKSFFLIIHFFIARIRRDEKWVMLQIMPSPTDIVLDVLAKLTKVCIIRCIHDIKPHPGEKWPTLFAIKIRANFADCVITFSDFIKTGVHEFTNTRVLKSDLPRLIYSTKDNSVMNYFKSNQGVPKLAVIGRAIEYKGYRYLAESLELVNVDFEFAAFGKGNYPHKLMNLGSIQNRWLEDNEIEDIISKADILLFPYIEASQSGLIPLVMAQNKFIIASDVGGLAEQLKKYQNRITVPPEDVEALSRAITLAIDITKQDANSKYSNVEIHESKTLMEAVYEFLEAK